MSLPQTSSPKLRYAVAALAVAAAFAARFLLDGVLASSTPFFLAYPAIAVAGWYGGLGPALVATALSMLGAGVLSRTAEPMPAWSNGLTFALFGFSGVLIGLLWESLHRERARSSRSADARLRDMLAASREHEARLQRIVDTVPALISYIGTDARYRLVNRSYERWFGQAPESVRGKHMREVLGEEVWLRLEPFVVRASAGESVSFETEVPYRGLGARWVQVSYTPDRAPDGAVHGVVVLVTDVTERRRADDERAQLYASEQRARAQAEASDKAKDQFLAVLSHELRAPLTPVLTAAQMLESAGTLQAARIRSLAALIRKNAELEARLIDDMLDLTRVTRGKLSLHLESVDAHAKVREVLGACARDLEQKDLRVELAFGAQNHHVRADQARFQQVIWNLVKNAVKFSHEGGLVRIRTSEGEGGTLVLEISDQGVGIDPDLLPKLFNAFEQGGREVTHRFGGLGLGLAVSKALVEAQGGTIAAASAGRERGATFTVTMPLARVAAGAAAARTEENSSMSQTHRILLVEDHEDTSEVMAEFLESSGYQVKIADTVASALEAADEEEFDLVLSDLGLPDGTGYELMRALRERHHRLLGVALSGYGRDKDVEEARAAGFVEHVTKPPNPQQLLKVLSRVLESAPATNH